MTVSEFAAFLRTHDQYLIITHRRPDGDTIGSAAALCRGLRSMGKAAWVLENCQFTPMFSPFLQGLVRAESPENATVLSVDVADDRLISLDAERLSLSPAAAIDHHGTNSLTCPNTLILPECAACGQIIYQLLLALEISVTEDMAAALYVAISTDTGCFKYSNTTAETHRIVADLLATGVDVSEINRIFFDTKSIHRFRLEAYLTESMEFFADGTVCICAIPDSVLQRLGVTEDDISSISGLARMVEGVQIGITIREEENGAKGKISLRTDRHYNASALCSQLGGGGHAAAAGASVPGGIAAAREAILRVLKDAGIAL